MLALGFDKRCLSLQSGLGFTVSELGFALLKLGSTLSGLGSAFLKPGSEEQLKPAKL